ncbi:uncharacterized protein K452DRAFT_233183 [Aplosporella prunicola CBS 121167]|uniref:FAD-binding domain-containing protein n=1 Tax=Aplosporella prunicola CBS 121167 TaxID=1176127 RepID=A0A6A6B4N0_9PEZI|nr:uncharacterized protein K452DRAFT_233183 [Aplosporella prunicola CBS 121167]KAF2139112.1 hypothetical protein K452DRAFT_233183 [Aplosporella prunicola CBS 121167]
MPQPPITVLIIGAGFAGLTAAIECTRHAQRVILLEAAPALKPLGDIISLGHNAGRIIQRWDGGRVARELAPLCHRSSGMAVRSADGELLVHQEWADSDAAFAKGDGEKFNGHRAEIHEVLWRHARRVGVDVRLGCRVERYFESADGAGVVLAGSGEKVTADVVLAADGVRSTARTAVLGYEDRPKSSGYAIWRAWFSAEELAKEPLTRHLVVDGDRHEAWIGPDVHFIAASLKGGKDFSWVCTHKDTTDVKESWSAPGSIDEALAVLANWDPVVRAIVRLTPPARLVDWKLVYRDPLPTWVSPGRRIALLGDAAHPFLPTSIQGASQAMEDGATLAVCLELAGTAGTAGTGAAEGTRARNGVPEALRAYERIRYERVRRAQKTGESTRDRWHKADVEQVRRDPDAVKLPREEWLLGHDAEAHAYAVYGETVEQLRREDEVEVKRSVL